MTLYVDSQGQLVIEPSATPLGAGNVVVAKNATDAFEVFCSLIDWIIKTKNPSCVIGAITWYLQDNRVDGEGDVILSYSLGASNKVELFRYRKLAGVISWLFQQFKIIIPDLGDLK